MSNSLLPNMQLHFAVCTRAFWQSPIARSTGLQELEISKVHWRPGNLVPCVLGFHFSDLSAPSRFLFREYPVQKTPVNELFIQVPWWQKVLAVSPLLLKETAASPREDFF